MGEEAGAREPFLYFTDHHDELADAVREGRRSEFAKFPEFSDPAARARIPDPNAPETYAALAATISMVPMPKIGARSIQSFCGLRRERIMPHFKGARSEGARHRPQSRDRAMAARQWRAADTRTAISDEDAVRARLPNTTPIWGKAAAMRISGDTTLAWIDA